MSQQSIDRANPTHNTLPHINAEQERRYKLIVANAVLLAVSDYELPQKRLNNILEKYVTQKSDREFAGLTILDDF